MAERLFQQVEQWLMNKIISQTLIFGPTMATNMSKTLPIK